MVLVWQILPGLLWSGSANFQQCFRVLVMHQIPRSGVIFAPLMFDQPPDHSDVFRI